MCQPVLEFDAASLPHAARTRRSLERHVMGATGFRGRSLAAAAGGSSGGAGPSGPSPAAAGGAGAPALRRQLQQAPPLRIAEEDGEPLEEPGSGGERGDALLPAAPAAAAGAAGAAARCHTATPLLCVAPCPAPQGQAGPEWPGRARHGLWPDVRDVCERPTAGSCKGAAMQHRNAAARPCAAA